MSGSDGVRSGAGLGLGPGASGFGGAESLLPEQRWQTLRVNSTTITGMLLSTPELVYGVSLVARTNPQYAALYDHTNRPQNLIGGIAAPAGSMGTFPAIPYSRLTLRRGIYVSFSDAGTERVISVMYR